MGEEKEQRVLLCAPYGRDAALACQVLEGAGLICHICKSLPDLLQELEQGAGAILTVEESLPDSESLPLKDYLSRQPNWSDLPVLVLTKAGVESPWAKRAYEQLGNLTLLERPVRSSTLISAMRSALRARMRQYEMRATDQRKDEFLAMLAHELRNPLAPISSAAGMLKLVATNPEKVTWASQIIARQVGHMTNLIDDLLDVARVTRGMISYKKEALDFRDIVTEAIEQVDPVIKGKQHQLALHIPSDPAPVTGDHKRLVQVVTNLLGNACKYTPDGGLLAVRLDLRAQEVRLEIRDNGIGMTQEMVSRVFDLFTQAERTPDRSQGGLGLGLALAKSLALAHEGNIVASSPGLAKGSTFTLTLPRLSGPPMQTPGQQVQAAPSRQPAQPLRILVVDDNADAADMLEQILSTAGHEVYVEYTAQHALARAEQVSPQVCVLDIGLPDMDGHILAQQLRSLPPTREAVLIAVTGYSHELEKKKSLQAGFNHHFVKPVNAGQLAQVLEQAISK